MAGFEIAVDHPLPVRHVECICQLGADAQDLVERQRPAEQAMGQRLPRQELEDQEVDAVLLPDVVQRTDVWMREAGDRTRLTAEPFAALRVARHVGRQDFDGDRAVKPCVAGFVDLSHPACPQRCDDLVGAESRAARRTHCLMTLDQLRTTVIGAGGLAPTGTRKRKR